MQVKQLNVVWVDENEFSPQTKWVRNNQLLGYEFPGYQTDVGTKQLVNVFAPSVQSIGNLNIYSQVFLMLSNAKREKTNSTLLESQVCNISFFFVQVALVKRDLDQINNAATRVVCLVPKFDHITPVLKRLHWRPVRYRVMFKILLLVNKACRSVQGTL